LRVCGWAALSAHGRQSANGSRTVREELAHRVFAVFLRVCISIHFSKSFRWQGVWRIVCDIHRQSAWCVVLADGPWCVHGRSVIEGVVLVAQELISDGPLQTREKLKDRLGDQRGGE
jgi:hypothetical protein